MSRWLLDLRRRRSRRQAGDGPLAALLDSELPAQRTAFENLELLCLDMETTGLDIDTAFAHNQNMISFMAEAHGRSSALDEHVADDADHLAVAVPVVTVRPVPSATAPRFTA